MNAGIVWMMTGIALCGAELLHPGVFLLWIGIAAIATGAIISATDSLLLPWQIAIFLVASAALLCIPSVRRRRRPLDDGVNAPDAGLVGQTCRVVAFDGAEGRVAFRDGVWPARMIEGLTPAPNTILRVTGLDGTTLLVAPDRRVIAPS